MDSLINKNLKGRWYIKQQEMALALTIIYQRYLINLTYFQLYKLNIIKSLDALSPYQELNLIKEKGIKMLLYSLLRIKKGIIK